MRIIIAEDETDFLFPMMARLEDEAFEVDAARSALEVYRCLAGSRYNIAIIDADLPDESALDLVAWIRRKSGMGIILLSDGNDVCERIHSLKNGADFNLIKPVNTEELVHAVLSLGRRLVPGEAPSAEPAADQWWFDAGHWTIEAPEGQLVKVTAAEVKFVTRLLLDPGAVTTRHELRTALGYSHDKAGDRNLDALVRRLRRRIEDLTGRPAPIQTVHGQGYLFSAPLRLERRAARNR